ncbi:hypothetical protein R3W88_014772 [Solanum pinnatisectum]|uniref:Fe2OG dioxygenase domain-containing protein n=1 Tax=Solanum pinnatisectum TaxID=50273 RepID=A0AAV9KV22_9SOLN|nr:hypothetical protein R3W88_014772 [Solanum pinnatisectum]
MASTKIKIPIIDFCNLELKPNTPQWECTKEQIFEALKEFGCFEAIYDKVPNEIREAMFGNLKEVFELPISKLIEYREKRRHIYEGQFPTIPIYGSNEANSFYKPLMELDEMLRRMIFETLGLKHYIDEFLDSNIFFSRFKNYKANKGKDGDIPELPSHTNSVYLSIVKQEQIGLQVLNKNGEWIELNTSPNSYFVLVGDVLMTNGRLQSAPHRVHMESDRYSSQLFSLPKPDYTVKVPKELVDEEQPLLFKPFNVSEFYKYIILCAKIGPNLKKYCGL